jgi:hypothetical protein
VVKGRGIDYTSGAMRKFSILLAVFFVLQGPLCALDGFAMAAAMETSEASASHDCCPESQESPGNPGGSSGEHGAGGGLEACAAHCAALSQALASTTSSPGKILTVALIHPVAGEALPSPVAAPVGPGPGLGPLLLQALASRNSPLLI